MKKTVVIITGHPDKESFCAAQSSALKKAATKQGFAVKQFWAFNYPLPDNHPYKGGFSDVYNEVGDVIAEAEYIVVCCPMWNFGLPGGLKNFLDGALQVKKAFRFQGHPLLSWLSKKPFFSRLLPGGFPVGLLKAKKVLCVLTTDSPKWYYGLVRGRNLVFPQIKRLFAFCGVRKCEKKLFGCVRGSCLEDRKQWLADLEKYGF